jgi:hypothetical protein
MSAIRLRSDELDLLTRMIDKRDSAHLSGHRDDPFRVAELNGGLSVLTYPGGMGADNVPTRTIRRFRSLDLFQIFNTGKNVVVFDLADDVRDRIEELRDEAGEPSVLAQERAARARAEDQQSRLEVRIERAARAREARRHAFAVKVGRWAYRLTNAALIAIYIVAIVLTTTFIAPAVGAVIGIGILAIIGILDWGFRRDAFGVAHACEKWAVERVERWLAGFEAEPES